MPAPRARFDPTATPLRMAPLLWLALLAICAVLVWRAPWVADLSVFLPGEPSMRQRILIDNLRSGALSRVVLAGVDDLPEARLGEFSRTLGERLRADARLMQVENGDPSAEQPTQRLVFEQRYRLSPAITARHFETPALRAAIEQSIDRLSSSQSALIKRLIPSDPTGELFEVLRLLDPGNGPRKVDGAWASPDGRSALLMLFLRADGTDLDAQQQALESVRATFDATRHALGIEQARLTLTGPAVFALDSRDSIRSDVLRLSHIGAALILLLMWLFLRSPVPMLLTAVPLVSAVLAGAAVVVLCFGALHGLTLGFGIPLIGEAIDYALYQLIGGHRLRGGERHAFWSTIRLGVLTSIAGFAALALSGFPGLTQMSVFSISGLLAAALTTRFVVPSLTPASFVPPDLGRLEHALRIAIAGARRLAWPAVLLVLGAVGLIAASHQRLWSDDIAMLNPVASAAQAVDQRMRDALDAPQAGQMIAVVAANQESALQGAEAVAEILDRWVADGRLAGYDSPAQVLPSLRTQQARQAALPEESVLRQRLGQATEGLPLRAERLESFVQQVAAARVAPPLQAQALEGTALGLKWASLMQIRAREQTKTHKQTKTHEQTRPQAGGQPGPDEAVALLPLRLVRGEPTVDVDALQRELRALSLPGVEMHAFDLKQETDALYAGYLHQAILLSCLGALAIVVLLALSLRSARALGAVVAPLFGAVVLVIATFVLLHRPLTLLHLVGLLLVVAVGSNYTLFLRSLRQARPGMLASLLFANLATVAGFAVMGYSRVPLLSALGTTVALGAGLALCLAAAWIDSESETP